MTYKLHDFVVVNDRVVEVISLNAKNHQGQWYNGRALPDESIVTFLESESRLALNDEKARALGLAYQRICDGLTPDQLIHELEFTHLNHMISARWEAEHRNQEIYSFAFALLGHNPLPSQDWVCRYLMQLTGLVGGDHDFDTFYHHTMDRDIHVFLWQQRVAGITWENGGLRFEINSTRQLQYSSYESVTETVYASYSDGKVSITEQDSTYIGGVVGISAALQHHIEHEVTRFHRCQDKKFLKGKPVRKHIAKDVLGTEYTWYSWHGNSMAKLLKSIKGLTYVKTIKIKYKSALKKKS